MEKMRFLEIIWTDFVQVYTNINYSSLYSESLREKQKDIYYWVIYACFGLPPILSLIVKRYALNNEWLFLGMIILILLLPLVLRIKNKQLIYSVFGIHEKEIGGLLKLNEDLDRCKDTLLTFYFRVEAMPENSTKWREKQLEYEKIKRENARYLTEHDRLTGKIDPVIQKIAQEKTFEMIKNSNYYGKGNTSEG